MIVEKERLYKNALALWSDLDEHLETDMNVGTEAKPKFQKIRDMITAPTIFYTEDGLNKLFPEEVRWNSDRLNADKTIQVFLGYMNGDATKIDTDELSDTNPHSIIIGGTGSGKSFSYYHYVDSICSVYSPNDVRLWFFDGKKVTFSSYAARGSLERLPHMEACCCTNDAVYAASYFEGYMKSMKDYQLMFMSGENPDKFTTDSIKDWNQHWRKAAAKDPTMIKYCVPRKILLIDELGALFSRIEGEYKKRITDALSQAGKEGRALGHHVICSSQMPDDIPENLFKQSSLRICLQCFGSPEMSRKMIDEDYAAKITQKCGICYVKSKKGNHQLPVRINIPMTREQVVTNEKGIGYVNRLYKRAIDNKIKLPFLITYDDSFPIKYETLEEHYKIYQDKLKDRTDITMDNMFLFGIPMAYNPKQTLTYNRFFREEPSAHIYAEMDDEEDLFNFLMVMLWNINKNKCGLVINSQLLDAQNEYLRLKDWSDTPEDVMKMKWKEICNQIYSLYEERKVSGKKDPVWFMLVGINNDLDFGMTMTGGEAREVAAMLADISRLGIHVCFLNFGKHKSRDEITESVSTCITDMVDKETSSNILKRSDGAYPAGELVKNFLNIKDRNQFTRVRLFTSDEPTGKSMARGVEI